MRLNIFGAALLALVATAGMAEAQFTLVNNGDFSAAGGEDWNDAASGGTVLTYEDAGGNPGGFGKIDATAGTWGGVLVAEGGVGANQAAGDGQSLTSLGLVAGNSYDFQWDQIDLGANGAIAGIKMESWAGGALISDSGDQLVATNATWTTETFNYTIEGTADALKFVMVQNQGFVGAGGVTGFDNVGVVATGIPEPGSLGLIALGLVGLVARRRRS